MWIYQYNEWPNFTWDPAVISDELAAIRYEQGRLLGRMQSLGFAFQSQATWQTLTEDVLKSSLIEGENLPKEEVRSSVARKLGLSVGGLVPSSRHVDGVVQLMIDATQQFQNRLTQDRLFMWHSLLFPDEISGGRKILTGTWRENSIDDPMQVVSGPLGKERVHFQAPDSALMPKEMQLFLMWFNGRSKVDPVIKAAIAHLWFLTLHPFEDGNGRMARSLSDLLLARSDNTAHRFYSMSSQIEKHKEAYYHILEKTQRYKLDVTEWVEWFLQNLLGAIQSSEELLDRTLFKANFWQSEKLHGINERQRIMLTRLFEDFEGKLTSAKWAKIMKVSQDTAQRDINDLIAREILIREEAGGRSTGYSWKL